ncbi:MAG: hypothetical protein A3J75_00090 [Acidobacteria bacterium RBG_16_68_9]|nr:MAG: hypothetical protein A3J75_00090 [Acidobacteria bacterium RBG_16_68_9]
MLTITNLCRSFAGQVVFDHASWFIPTGARVGLVGANGSGKTTLLRMIAGGDEPDAGTIATPKGTTIGYLPQEVIGVSGRTVLNEALEAFADTLALERECRGLENALSDSDPDDPAHERLLAAYTRARERWDVEGCYDSESQARTVLCGLGFRPADLSRDAGEFSGGWQMRLALAKLLLGRPTLLLLDEPTNHLDLEARNWLEAFLSDYPHTVILVAHDRYFLDVTVNRITEVSKGKLIDYHTTYSTYLVDREERRAREMEAYRGQQEEIARIEAFISRFRYQASKAALVQSRIKQLERVERLPPPDAAPAPIQFRFPPCERSGRVVLRLTEATKRFGDVTVYERLNLTVERGCKVALVGPNGAGKSTLIKLLAGIEPLTGGTLHIGHHVTLGHFAQDQTNVLDPTSTPLDELTVAAPFDLVPQVRNLLAAFLFRGDSVYKRIAVLSGGERNRLALAKLLLQPSNCLLLDEPTNHLDIAAKEILLEALQQYRGTLVLVAHDRYLLDHLPDEIIEVGSGHATRYLGNYEDYLRARAGTSGATAPASMAAAGQDNDVPEPDATACARERGKTRRRSRSVPTREEAAVRIERDIAEKERELAGLAAIINAPNFYRAHEDPHAIFSQYAHTKKNIDALYNKLERLEQQPAAPQPAAGG